MKNKKFIIRCVTSIDELDRLENITGLKGLKYTILNNTVTRKMTMKI